MIYDVIVPCLSDKALPEFLEQIPNYAVVIRGHDLETIAHEWHSARWHLMHMSETVKPWWDGLTC